MGEKYPTIVCLDCLKDACEDNKKYLNHTCKWSSVFSVYVDKCQICNEMKECTEPCDAGYPTFKYIKLRHRSKKLNKLINESKKDT